MSSAYVWFPLRKEKTVLVDLVDLDLAEKCTYHHRVGGTYQIFGQVKQPSGKYVAFQLCRLILERVLGRLLLEKEIVYHINKNPFDNRRCNLRLVLARESRQTRKPHRDNKSGFRGVSFRPDKKEGQQWQAQIRLNGKVCHLGFYETPEKASDVYENKLASLFEDITKRER